MKLISHYATRTMFWVRVPCGGYGFCLRSAREHPLRFSERNGHKRYFRLGPFILTFLRP